MMLRDACMSPVDVDFEGERNDLMKVRKADYKYKSKGNSNDYP